MINTHGDTKLIGTTDLRSNMPNLTKELKIKNVIVMKRGKPIAVLEDYEQHQEKQEIIETFEDMVLGYLAKERYEKSKRSDYVDEEKIFKKLGLKQI